MFDPRRYTGYATSAYTAAKAVELYQNEYAVGFPFEERPAGRPARTTPLYPVLAAKGARFAARNGWERAAFFDPAGTIEEPTLTLRRDRNWNDLVAAEVRAVREAVGVIDLGGFSKFMLDGPRRRGRCSTGCSARACPKLGRIGLCYALDAKGGVVSEFTVTRLAEDRFYLVCRQHRRVARRGSATRRLALPTGGARLDPVLGPARHSGRRRPGRPRRSQTGDPGRPVECRLPMAVGARDRAWLRSGPGPARRTMSGELGWELHLPMEQLLPAYEAIMAAGATRGIRDVGIYAVESMRLDKCYRSWKQDLETGFTAFEAGLDRFVDLDQARLRRQVGAARRT